MNPTAKKIPIVGSGPPRSGPSPRIPEEESDFPLPPPKPTPLQLFHVSVSIALLFINYFLAQYDKFILSYFRLPIRDTLGITEPQYALISGYSTGIVYALLALPVAFVADYTAARVWVLSVAAAWWSLCVIFQGLSRDFGQLFCARLGMGVGQAAVEALGVSLISDFVGWRNVFVGNSVFYVGVYVGEAVSGQIANAFVRTDTGWRTALKAIGITGIVVAVFVRLVLREPPRRRSIIDGREGLAAVRKKSESIWRWKQVEEDLKDTLLYLVRMRSFWALVLSSSMRLLAGNVFGYYMPGYLHTIYPNIDNLFSRYGIIVGTVGSATVLAGGLISAWLWPRTKLTPILLTGIGGMISSVFVMLMIFSRSIAGGDEERGVRILYGVMCGSYLTAELWLGCFFSLIALILPPRYKTFGLAIWSSVQVLVYSSGPEIIGLALKDVDPESEEYSTATRTALGVIIVFGYWSCGLGLLASIPLLNRDLRQDFVQGPLSLRRRMGFFVFAGLVTALVITLFTMSLAYGL